MRKTRFWLLCATAVLAALATAASASATFTPQLSISATAAQGTIIRYAQPSGDDPVARVTTYVPIGGLVANFSAPSGTTLGTVLAKTAAGDLGGATLPLTGTVVARVLGDTYLSGSAQVPLAAAATQCLGPGVQPLAIWILALTAAGQKLEVPVFIVPVVAGSPFAAFSQATIVFCLPPPDLPPGTPGRAAFGAKVFDAAFSVKGVFTSPASEYKWRSLATPYVPTAGKVNAAATVEIQSLYRPDTRVTASAKRVKGKLQATVTGVVTQAFVGTANAPVTIRGGGRVVTTKTDISGGFKAVVPLRNLAGKLTVTATAPTKLLDPTFCTPTFGAAGIPCTAATVGGATVATAAFAVRP